MANHKMSAVLTVIMIVSLLLTACAQTSTTPSDKATTDSQTQQTSTVATDIKKSISIWNCDNSFPFEDGLKNMIAKFSAVYPNIKVEYTGLPWDSAKQKFGTAIATGTAPDLAYIVQQWVGDMAATGGLVPFNSYIDNWKHKNEYNLDLIFSAGLDVNGKLFMMPFEYGTTLCWYRADWFKDAGLSAPTTFDEFFDDIDKMTDIPNGRYGYSIRGGDGASNQLECFLSAYSGAKQYFLDNGECFVTDPKVLEGLERLVAIYKKNTPESDLTNGYAEMCAAFGSGVAAIIYHNNSSYPVLLNSLKDPKKIGAFFLPTADNGTRSMVIGSFGYAGWAMFEDSKNKDAAWQFVDFAVSADIQSEWNKLVGGLPTNLIAQDAEWINDYPALFQIKKVLSEPNAVFNVAPAYYPDYEKIHLNTLTPGFQAVLAGQKSAKDYLAEWNDLMKKAKIDYEKSISK